MQPFDFARANFLNSLKPIKQRKIPQTIYFKGKQFV